VVRGAVFFDVDGTPTPTSSGQHLAGLLGNAKEIEQIQARATPQAPATISPATT
jgi:phosphoserine phosphatase